MPSVEINQWRERKEEIMFMDAPAIKENTLELYIIDVCCDKKRTIMGKWVCSAYL